MAQGPRDVPLDHWAYTAVEDLAQKGLIRGYPPQGNFFGKRTVTRYEMATIIQRVLQRVDELLAQKADKGAAPEPGVTPAQLDAIRRLVDEFKIELVMIGGDVQKARDAIDALSGRVAKVEHLVQKNAADEVTVRAAIDENDRRVTEWGHTVSDIAAQLRSHRMSGYMQMRFDSFDRWNHSLFPPAGAGGTGQLPSVGGPAVGGPFGGFLVRRTRFKMSGPIGGSGRTDYGVQVEFPSFQGFTLKEAYADIAGLPFRGLVLTAGQFGIPFGRELEPSSSVRESPERALGFSDSTMSSQIFKTTTTALGGVVTPGSVLPLFLNQEYDQGIALTYAPNPREPETKYVIAAFNGEGSASGGVRNLNNGVDVVGRADHVFLSDRLRVGVSGYYGTLAVRGAPPNAAGTPAPFVNALRELAGIDCRYVFRSGTYVRAEYLGGVFETTPDRALYLENNHVQAWYAVVRQPLTRKLDAAIKYDEFMPISQSGKYAGGFGRMTLERKTLQGGLLYHLDQATMLRLWYQRGLMPYDPTAAAGPLRSRLGYVTAEVQIVY